MKYARLSSEELSKLEQEFINFLVVNGITADDWVSLKENEPLKADEIVNQFSDVVWESILRSTVYLNKVENTVAYYFKCEEKEIHLIRVIKNSNGESEKQIASKAYKKVRELEMFDMINNGCVISEGEEFIALS